MLRALVPVDGSHNALCAVRYAIRLVQDGEPLEIHLLNVQPPFHGDVASFVPKGGMHSFHRERGHEAMAGACALLDEARIPYTRHIYVGHPAKTIAACAKDLRCVKVVMGTHGYGTVTQLLLGSVSHEAIHQMDPHIPVTLVKAGYDSLTTSTRS